VTSTALLAGAPGTWHDYHWQLPLHAREDATLAETVNDLADELRTHVPSSALPLFPRATVAGVGGADEEEDSPNNKGEDSPKKGEALPNKGEALPNKGKLMEKALATLAQVTAEAEAARDTTHLELAADLSDGNPTVRRRAAQELRKHQLLFSYLDKSVPPRQRAEAEKSRAGARRPSHEEGSDAGAPRCRSPEALAFASRIKEAREAMLSASPKGANT
jgi:hypothetical protein